jgi:uncharacterized OB-fold protein
MMVDRPFSDISYKKYLSEEKLMGSRCKQCDVLFIPPRSICVECHSKDMAWEESKGVGKLAAFTCITIGPSFMRAEGYDRKNPYCSGVVELEEGTRVDARIEGVDSKNPENIKIGMPLKVQFLHRPEDEPDRTYLAFQPS